MYRIKAVVIEKRQSEIRYESKLLAIFRTYRTIRILIQVPKMTAFH